MDNILYDPERILHGFTIEGLKDLAKKLKRKIKPTKSEIIQEILSNPRGKPEDTVKAWQEINRSLRKELETLSQEAFSLVSSGNVAREEAFKVGYMFTLSSDSEIKALGEEVYCRRAEEEKALANDIKEETVAVLSRMMEKDSENRDAQETIESRDIIETENMMLISNESKMPYKEQIIEETEELQKRIKTLEHKLQKVTTEGQRTKGQLEKLRIDMKTLKSQLIREEAETVKARNRVKELEEERTAKEKELELLKQKVEQKETLPPQTIKEQLHVQRRDPIQVKDELGDEIDLAAYQGRKALIFAERDNEVDIRLNALGIIPIWAMEIDWNRPRRRMSTCQLVLYEKNDALQNKLKEIREIASYWNIPCNVLSNFSGGIVHD